MFQTHLNNVKYLSSGCSPQQYIWTQQMEKRECVKSMTAIWKPEDVTVPPPPPHTLYTLFTFPTETINFSARWEWSRRLQRKNQVTGTNGVPRQMIEYVLYILLMGHYHWPTLIPPSFIWEISKPEYQDTDYLQKNDRHRLAEYHQ